MISSLMLVLIVFFLWLSAAGEQAAAQAATASVDASLLGLLIADLNTLSILKAAQPKVAEQ